MTCKNRKPDRCSNGNYWGWGSAKPVCLKSVEYPFIGHGSNKPIWTELEEELHVFANKSGTSGKTVVVEESTEMSSSCLH